MAVRAGDQMEQAAATAVVAMAPTNSTNETRKITDCPANVELSCKGPVCDRQIAGRAAACYRQLTEPAHSTHLPTGGSETSPTHRSSWAFVSWSASLGGVRRGPRRCRHER